MSNWTLARRTALGLMAAAPALAASAARAQPLPGPWTAQGDVTTAAGSLHYATLGEGEPLVLLHKLGGWIADWRHVAPALATKHKLIVIDLPGHGESRMNGPVPWMMSLPESTAMVLAVLEELRVGRFSVAGNSMGGIIGIMLAALWPDRVRTLGLVSVSLIEALSRETIEAQDVERKATGGVLTANVFNTLVPSVAEEQAAARAHAGPWLRACERGVGFAGVTQYLPRIKAPTLLVNADRGQYVRHIETGLAKIPNASSVVIPGSGSFVHQEKPAEVAAAMNAFYARHPAA